LDWSIFLRVTAPDLLENPCLQLFLNYYIAARISTPFLGQLHINIKTFMHKQAINHKQAIIGGGYLFTENACLKTFHHECEL